MDNKPNNEELIQAGLELLDNALSHFMEIDDSEHGKALANIVHGALVFGETIYDMYKK